MIKHKWRLWKTGAPDNARVIFTTNSRMMRNNNRPVFGITYQGTSVVSVYHIQRFYYLSNLTHWRYANKAEVKRARKLWEKHHPVKQLDGFIPPEKSRTVKHPMIIEWIIDWQELIDKADA